MVRYIQKSLSRCLSRRILLQRQRAAASAGTGGSWESLRDDRPGGPSVGLGARCRVKLSAEAARTERPDGGSGAEVPVRTASKEDRIAGVLSELSLREGRLFVVTQS